MSGGGGGSSVGRLETGTGYAEDRLLRDFGSRDPSCLPPPLALDLRRVGTAHTYRAYVSRIRVARTQMYIRVYLRV